MSGKADALFVSGGVGHTLVSTITPEDRMLKDTPIIPYIPVANLSRARTFYQDVIGLEQRRCRQDEVGQARRVGHE